MEITDRKTFLSTLNSLQEKFDNLKPELELTVRDPDLGVEGYVIVWNTLAAIGGPLGRCGKGGTRITVKTSAEEIKMLARIMTLKNAAAGLPLGGAKSGMCADSDAPDFKAKYCRFVELVKPILRENGGIFGGFGFDIGSKPEHAKWACETLNSTKSFTGKPLELGGTDYDREGIAGFGVAHAAKTAVERAKRNVKEVTFGVQGIGAMGAAVIRYMSEFGAKLVAISDPRIGGTYRFDIEVPENLLQSLVKMDIAASNTILASMQVQKKSLDEILYEECDILFPCAVQNVLFADNAAKIKASFVVEGANNPCNAEARTYFFKNKITVVPDFIANPGGIIAAFVEMTSSASIEDNIKNRTKVLEAKKMTMDKVSANVSTMLGLVEKFNVEPVQAGTYMALSNIFKSNAIL